MGIKNLFKKKASRQVRGHAPNTNKLNLKVAIYLNPGGWTDGRTDFGIVSGDQLALCSWTPPPQGQGGRAKVKGSDCGVAQGAAAITRRNPIWRFLFGEKNRIHVFGSYRTPAGRVNFTKKDEMIVFLPDTHLHMFRGSPADGFTRWEWEEPENQQGKWVRKSQVGELIELLKYCRQFKAAGGTKLKIIQLGDLVDIWHVQLICLQAHHFLLNELGVPLQGEDDTVPRNYWIDATVEGETARIKRVAYGIPPDDGSWWLMNNSSGWPNEVPAFDALVLFMEALRRRLKAKSEEFWRKFPVPTSLRWVTIDYTDWRKIYDEIKKRYPELNDYWSDFVAIPGNHDMFVEHPYLGFRYKYAFPPGRFNRTIFAKMKGADRQDAFQKMSNYGITYRDTQPVLTQYMDTTGKLPRFRNRVEEMETHVYWVDHEDDGRGCPTAAKLEDGATVDQITEQTKTKHGFLTGENNCIWFEHGHAFDAYNNRHTFFREDHPWNTFAEIMATGAGDLRSGFINTFIGISDKFKGYKEGGGPSPDSTKMKVGNKQLNQYCMERCQKIFKAKKGKMGIRLVVLAHTHYPWLIANPRKYSTYWQRQRFSVSALAKGIGKKVKKWVGKRSN